MSTMLEHGTNPTGVLAAIWLKRMKRGPMDPHSHARTVAGAGLEGNADLGRKRQVTIIDAGAWDDVCEAVGRAVDPSTRRANLLTRGVPLAHSRGRILNVGGCRIRILGETRPCRRMDESVAGLQQALDPDWRGGVFGEVLDDAEISIGDPVSWVTEATS